MSNPSGILVVVAHPYGDLVVPLETWMRTGPGPRTLVQLRAAKDAATGEPLPLSVVPFGYRNTDFERFLIRWRILRSPW